MKIVTLRFGQLRSTWFAKPMPTFTTLHWISQYEQTNTTCWMTRFTINKFYIVSSSIEIGCHIIIDFKLFNKPLKEQKILSAFITPIENFINSNPNKHFILSFFYNNNPTRSKSPLYAASCFVTWESHFSRLEKVQSFEECIISV